MNDDPARLAHQLDVLAKAPAQHGHVVDDIPGIRTEIQYPKYKAVREREVRLPIVGGVVTVDLARGRVFTPSPLTGTTTIQIINHPPVGVEVTVTLFIPQDSIGNHAIIWPANVSFEPAPPPVSGPNKIDLITLTTWDGGVTYHGYYAGGGTSTAGVVVNSYDLTITGTHENLNLRDYVKNNTSWDGVSPIDASISVAESAVIGSLDPTKPALDIGQFPAGTYITLNVYGQIQGAGGYANAGKGGDAIYANYPNQAITIICQATGTIMAGGGGGGKGGAGGGGYYTTTSYTYIDIDYREVGSTTTCADLFGAGSTCSEITDAEGWEGACSQCKVPHTNYHYTTGGVGGNGGRGIGYAIASAAGVSGSLGGTNAGAGGNGGSGGTWGAYGSTGQTGANGNNGAGLAGSAGGAPGNAIVKSTSNVYTTTLTGGTFIGGTV